MPVLPLVESSRILPGASWPARRASRMMLAAARSLTDPPGLYHSAFPSNSTPGRLEVKAFSGSSGVLPMRDKTASSARVCDSLGDDIVVGAGFELAALIGKLCWQLML